MKFRKGTRFWDGEPVTETKAVDSTYIVNLTQWSQEITSAIMASLRREVRKMINDEIDLLGDHNIDVRKAMQPTFVDDATRNTENMVYAAARRQTERVISRITELDREGADLATIKKEIRTLLDKRGSWNNQLAIYTVTSGVETARNQLWKLVGDKLEKSWKTENDEKVRPSHRAVNGVTIPASEDFVVGGFAMIGPGDTRAPIHETANCRCWTEVAIKEN